jgi:hypothetical protein
MAWAKQHKPELLQQSDVRARIRQLEHVRLAGFLRACLVCRLCHTL